MTLKIHFKGDYPSREMSFKPDTELEEALSKSLASLSSEERDCVTAIYITKDGSSQPTVAVEQSSPR